ncbi:uncharacterized protein C20orf204 homolog [Erinaceus europaeus]|uniref:Uncharacterized protein C20orf204 homolog n=1 Tax=Erinaceus europaeus TaxID=9365 RepID=A0ABM3VRN4_ERIEU|nr:uncharacterized protein C20orf204 homolog [Erinaceus europaeus]
MARQRLLGQVAVAMTSRCKRPPCPSWGRLREKATGHPTAGSSLALAWGSDGGCPNRRLLQVPPRLVVWALLLLGLGLRGGRAGRGCSVPDVLRHYRAVIFEDLQAAVRRAGPSSRQRYFHQKNLTGAGALPQRGLVGASCSAQKERNILLSIAALGRSLQEAVAGGGRGALEKAARTVAARTEAVLRLHCPTLRQSPRPTTRPARRPGHPRQLLLRALHAVATCWAKLFALHGPAAEG